MKYIQQIVLQEKFGSKVGINGDWRSFCYCNNNSTNWILNGYGHTPQEAAQNVYGRYLEPVETWSCFGHTLPNTQIHKYPNSEGDLS